MEKTWFDIEKEKEKVFLQEKLDKAFNLLTSLMTAESITFHYDREPSETIKLGYGDIVSMCKGLNEEILFRSSLLKG